MRLNSLFHWVTHSVAKSRFPIASFCPLVVAGIVLDVSDGVYDSFSSVKTGEFLLLPSKYGKSDTIRNPHLPYG